MLNMSKIYQSPRVRFITMSTEDSLLVTSLLYARPSKGGHEGYGDEIDIFAENEVASKSPARQSGFQSQCWGE